MSDIYDIAIIGSGPGGYVAAIRAAQLGKKVVVVERSHLGGICLNWGCIPTKALLKSGEMYASVAEGLAAYGVTTTSPVMDFGKIVERSRDSAKKLSAGVAFLMRKNKIDVVEGTATLEQAIGTPAINVVLKSGETSYISAEHVIIATGARARVIPQIGLEPDTEKVWTYREAMVPAKIPKSLIVIGSGAIGVEFASFYSSLGAEVTVIEARERILPIEDEEISTVARKSLERKGIKFRLSASVQTLTKSDAGVRVELDVGGAAELLEAEVAIVAIGVVGNVENIGLEELNVEMTQGHIVVDELGATNVPGLYAIGDVAGAPMLAHKAMHEGVRCIEGIAGLAHPGELSPVPSCTYSQPQIASIGLTEAQARAADKSIKVGRFHFRNNGKAIASGETDGLVKTIFDGTSGQLIGAHLIGAEVTELVQGFAIAMTLKATEADLARVVFPHPTLSEVMHEASLAAYGAALHI